MTLIKKVPIIPDNGYFTLYCLLKHVLIFNCFFCIVGLKAKKSGLKKRRIHSLSNE